MKGVHSSGNGDPLIVAETGSVQRGKEGIAGKQPNGEEGEILEHGVILRKNVRLLEVSHDGGPREREGATSQGRRERALHEQKEVRPQVQVEVSVTVVQQAGVRRLVARPALRIAGIVLEELVVHCFHELNHGGIVGLVQEQGEEGSELHAYERRYLEEGFLGTAGVIVLFRREGNRKGRLQLMPSSLANRGDVQKEEKGVIEAKIGSTLVISKRTVLEHKSEGKRCVLRRVV